MLVRLLRAAISTGAVMALALSALLVAVHLSTAGLVFGAAGCLLALAALLGCGAWRKRSREWGVAAGLALLGWLAGTAWLIARAPDGRAAADATVQNRYADGGAHFRRYALGNLLPEGDQLVMGFPLIPAVDLLFTRQQAKKLTDLTVATYREMEADPNFRALPSAMPETYDELWRRPFNHGQYFLYIPPRLDRTVPHPALVFLHGSGGNFKAYTWILSKVADELGMVLLAPSYGLGNWRTSDAGRLVENVLADAGKAVAIDQENVHLIGLSNGGLGVSQAGRTIGSHLQSLTFLSPVFDAEAITSTEFVEAWDGRRIYVISGREDDRIPIQYVSENVDSMHRQAAQVEFRRVEGADHFLVFSHREVLCETLVEWLREAASGRSP